MTAQTRLPPARAEKFRLVLRRLAAYWIDCLLSFLGVILLNLVLLPVNPLLKLIQTGAPVSGWQYHLWVLAVASLPIWIYFIVAQSRAGQATPGMRLLKLRLTRLDGSRLSPGEALMRTAILMVPFEINHVFVAYIYPSLPPGQPALAWLLFAFICLICIAYISLCFITPRGQSLHDLAARTLISSR